MGTFTELFIYLEMLVYGKCKGPPSMRLCVCEQTVQVNGKLRQRQLSDQVW